MTELVLDHYDKYERNEHYSKTTANHGNPIHEEITPTKRQVYESADVYVLGYVFYSWKETIQSNYLSGNVYLI